MNGPKEVEYEINELSTNLAELVTVPADITRSVDNPHIKVFKWYNWGHGNFEAEVKALVGSANFYLNHMSETHYGENSYSAIGLNAENSYWNAKLSSEP